MPLAASGVSLVAAAQYVILLDIALLLVCEEVGSYVPRCPLAIFDNRLLQMISIVPEESDTVRARWKGHPSSCPKKVCKHGIKKEQFGEGIRTDNLGWCAAELVRARMLLSVSLQGCFLDLHRNILLQLGQALYFCVNHRVLMTNCGVGRAQRGKKRRAPRRGGTLYAACPVRAYACGGVKVFQHPPGFTLWELRTRFLMFFYKPEWSIMLMFIWDLLLLWVYEKKIHVCCMYMQSVI